MILKRLLLVTMLLVLAACTTARRGEPLAGPLKLDEKAARGEKVFMVHCHKCHPGGESGLGFAINNKPLPEAMIKMQTRAGAGAMPSFSRELLPDEDLDDLLAYIKVLRKQKTE